MKNITNFCSNCGNEIEQIEARFCVNCGHSLIKPTLVEDVNKPKNPPNTHSESKVNLFFAIAHKISHLPKNIQIYIWSMSVLLGIYLFFNAWRLNELIFSDFGIELINSVRDINNSLEGLGVRQLSVTDEWEIHRNLYFLGGLFFSSLPWTFRYIKIIYFKITNYIKKTYELLLTKFSNSKNIEESSIQENEFNNKLNSRNSKYIFLIITFISFAAIGLFFWQGGEAKLDNSCVMNGFGNGSCSFTNLGDATGSVCGYIKVVAYYHEIATSEVFCSGKVQPSSTSKVEFSIPSVNSKCPFGLGSGKCEFNFFTK